MTLKQKQWLDKLSGKQAFLTLFKLCEKGEMTMPVFKEAMEYKMNNSLEAIDNIFGVDEQTVDNSKITG